MSGVVGVAVTDRNTLVADWLIRTDKEQTKRGWRRMMLQDVVLQQEIEKRRAACMLTDVDLGGAWFEKVEGKIKYGGNALEAAMKRRRADG